MCEPVSSRPKSCTFLKNAPEILAVRCSLLALAGRKQTVVRDLSALPSETSRFASLILALKGSQHSPGPSTIELPSTLAESSAYSPDKACHGTLVRTAAPYQAFTTVPSAICHLPLACHLLPKGAKLEFGKGAPGGRHPQPTKPPLRLNRPAESRGQPVVCLLLFISH